MKYVVDLTEKAKDGVKKFKKAGDKQALKKLEQLLEELEVHPKTGSGRPKLLVGYDGERWSRRITDKHRLVYEIFEEVVTVEVIQTYGHYDDK